MPTRLRTLRAASGKFGWLLLALLVFVATAPIIAKGLAGKLVLSVFAASVLVAGLYAAQPRRRSLVVGLVLASIDLTIGRLANIDGTGWLLMLQVVLWLATMIYVALAILEVVLASRPVTIETLQAAFCVFLLLGLVWVYLYLFIELVAPGSFQVEGQTQPLWGEAGARRLGFLRFMILSYSTLTSRAYDELVPVSDFANVCGCLQSMMAQVYLAVVIARLVGLQASETAPIPVSDRSEIDGG